MLKSIGSTRLWSDVHNVSSVLTSSSLDFNSTYTRIAAICAVPKSGDITGVCFALQGVTTAQDIRAAIQTLSSGLPSGSNYKGSASGTIASASLAANQVLDVTLGTQATAAVVGDSVAIVLDWPGTAGNVKALMPASGSTPTVNYSVFARYTASAWSKTFSTAMVAGFKYSDGSYAACAPLFSALAALSYNGDAAGADEYGIVLPIAAKCRAIGATAYFQTGTPPANLLMTLYSGTTPVASCKLDGSWLYTSVAGFRQFLFSTPVELAPGTYRLALTCEGSAASIPLSISTVTSNAQLATWPGGAGSYLTKRVDGVTWSSGTPSYGAAAWTDVDTQHVPLALIVDQLDDGGGYTPSPCILGA